MYLVTIEAGIGAGKSTLLEKLSKHFQVIPEPVKLWQNYNNVNYLDLYYKAPQQNCFKFQNLVLLSYLKQDIHHHSSQGILVSERSLQTSSKVFIPLAKECGYLSSDESFQLQDWSHALSSKVKQPNHTIYIKVSSHECLNRLKERNRKEETLVELDYLTKINNLHDQWLLDNPNVSIIDGHQTPKKIYEQVLNIINQVSGISTFQ